MTDQVKDTECSFQEDGKCPSYCDKADCDCYAILRNQKTKFLCEKVMGWAKFKSTTNEILWIGSGARAGLLVSDFDPFTNSADRAMLVVEMQKHGYHIHIHHGNIKGSLFTDVTVFKDANSIGYAEGAPADCIVAEAIYAAVTKESA